MKLRNREKMVQKKDPEKLKEELEKLRSQEKKGQLDKMGKDKKTQMEKMYADVQQFRMVKGTVISFFERSRHVMVTSCDL